MTVYLDVAVVRIGTYLGRWPSLRGRRGASAQITHATQAATIGPVIAGQAETHNEAAQVDGVIALRIEPDADTNQVIAAVVAHLRSFLPAADFDAVWGEGENYFTSSIRRKRAAGEVLVAVAPAAEIPIGARCQLTGVDLATTTVKASDGQFRRAGSDTATRDAAAERRTDHRRPRDRGLDAETRLADETGLDDVNDFAGLAALASVAERKSNHLATVFADGNAIGSLFNNLANDDPARCTEFSELLKDATWQALVTSTNATISALQASSDSPITKLPVIPHVVGGDDVVVSVPAALGWTFTTSYLQAFTDLATAGLQRLYDEPIDISVTASAGICIAHEAHPFATTVDLADERLRDAKAYDPGIATVAWIDVTRDGEQHDGRRTPWTLVDLTGRRDVLDELASMQHHRRYALAEAVSHHEPSLAEAHAGELFRRHGSRGPAAALSAEPDRLREAISIAEWWTL